MTRTALSGQLDGMTELERIHRLVEILLSQINDLQAEARQIAAERYAEAAAIYDDAARLDLIHAATGQPPADDAPEPPRPLHGVPSSA